MSLEQRVKEEFERRFDAKPTAVVRAPGRVNLIGEHTDYNDGFVMPMAIERAVWIALRPRDDGYAVVYSIDFDEVVEFSLIEMTRRHSAWAEYIKGVAWAMQEAGFNLNGFDGVIAGDVPVGAGLSSSAAVELASARAFVSVSDIAWDAPEMAKISQRAENQWVGVKCGIMDQMISAAGVAGHALLIDCRWLSLEPVPLPPNTAVVILDTSTRRELSGSNYNDRREQCEAAAKFLNVPALRDATLNQLEAIRELLDDVIYRRARHVITENARVLAAADAMRQGDAVTMGQLMDASHVSMRDDFEISSPALNAMVECAQAHEACYGARMTGGGFAGCAVALVRVDAVDAFVDATASCYKGRTGLIPAIYVSQPTAGASIEMDTAEA